MRKIVKEIECKCLVTATLDDDGNFSIRVASAAPVPDREGVTCTATLDGKHIPREKSEMVRSAMRALLDDCADQCAHEAIRRADEAGEVHKRMGLVGG